MPNRKLFGRSFLDFGRMKLYIGKSGVYLYIKVGKEDD